MDLEDLDLDLNLDDINLLDIKDLDDIDFNIDNIEGLDIDLESLDSNIEKTIEEIKTIDIKKEIDAIEIK